MTDSCAHEFSEVWPRIGVVGGGEGPVDALRREAIAAALLDAIPGAFVAKGREADGTPLDLLVASGTGPSARLSKEARVALTGISCDGADHLGVRPVLASGRDPETCARLRAELRVPVALVPDPILLAGSAFDNEFLRRRHDLLRSLGELPGGPLAVVPPGEDQLGATAAKAGLHVVSPAVLAALAPGDLAATLSRTRLVVSGDADLLLAAHAMSGAVCLALSMRDSERAALEAAGLPLATRADLSDEVRQGAVRPLADAVRAALDRHFGELVSVALAEVTRRCRADGGAVERLARALRDSEGTAADLERAWEARDRQLVGERIRFAERIRGMQLAADAHALVERELRGRAEVAEAHRTELVTSLERVGRQFGKEIGDLREAEALARAALDREREAAATARREAEAAAGRAAEMLRREAEAARAALGKTERELEESRSEAGRSRSEAEALRADLLRVGHERERAEASFAREARAREEAERAREEALESARTAAAESAAALEDARCEREGLRAELAARSDFGVHVVSELVQLRSRASEAERYRQELEAMRAEFVRFTNLRLFRYTAPLRAAYTRVRRLVGRA